MSNVVTNPVAEMTEAEKVEFIRNEFRQAYAEYLRLKHIHDAGPDLLKALKEAREALVAWMISPLTPDEVLNHRSIKAIDEAISKAEGQL